MDHYFSDNPFDGQQNSYLLAADTSRPITDKGAGNREDDRVDAREKVTGTAKFSAEYDFPNLSYGVLVGSTIAKGTIASMDSRAAERAPGVLSVITYRNAPKLPGYGTTAEAGQQPTWSGGLKIFHDEKIHYYGQPVALVIADTLERATYAANLVTMSFSKGAHQTDLYAVADKAGPPKNLRLAEYKRGEGDVYRQAPVSLTAEYVIPIEFHQPME